MYADVLGINRDSSIEMAARSPFPRTEASDYRLRCDHSSRQNVERRIQRKFEIILDRFSILRLGMLQYSQLAMGS